MNPSELGVVVIGRNEGARLERCLKSLESLAAPVVYVDSGSTDRSVEFARQWGAHVVELDRSEPFTAARARNAGLDRLLELSSARAVFFVDGDCEVVPTWIPRALAALASDPNAGVVCGRRQERSPEASIYNRLCDLEWDTPTGEALACGGDAVMRVEALGQVGGYLPTMIAGEEPELCVRLRERNWRILRLDAAMTLHDASMFRFRQWWQRSMRAGHAYAESAWLHGGTQRHLVRRVVSVPFWAMILPLTAVLLSWSTRGISLVALVLVYALLVLRIYLRQRRRRRTRRDSMLYASFVWLGKFAELCGMLRFVRGKLLRRRPRIIEYKQAEATPDATL